MQHSHNVNDCDNVVKGYFWVNQKPHDFCVMLTHVHDSAGSADAECTDGTHQLASA